MSSLEGNTYSFDQALQEIDKFVASGKPTNDWIMNIILQAGIFAWMSQDEGGGTTSSGLRFGSFKSETKWMNQMTRRGWTMDQIYEAIATEGFPAKNFVNPRNSATLYYHPTTGRAVVVDDVTNEILHIGGDNFSYSDWLLK